MKRFAFIWIVIFGFVFSFVSAGLTVSDLGMGVSRDLARPLNTGQTVKYADGDDGDMKLGLSKRYSVKTTGQYSGTTEITVDGDTHDTANACVHDNRTGLDWLREVVGADIGPAGDGKFFWEQWTITKTDISFVNATGKIHSAAGDFDTDALCAGRKFTISGSDLNDGTFTVSAIDANDITTVEGVAEEAAGDTIIVATSGGLIWDLLAAINAAGVSGYTDWRIPTYGELPKLVNLGNYDPCIDTTVFPSTPSSYHWTSSTRPGASAYAFSVDFSNGYVSYNSKMTKCYVRLVRG